MAAGRLRGRHDRLGNYTCGGGRAKGKIAAGLAELAVFAAAAVVGAVGGGGIAFRLAGDAGADAGEGLAAAFGDGFTAFVAVGGGFPGGEMGAGAGDGILDGVVDLVGDGAVGGPAGCHGLPPASGDQEKVGAAVGIVTVQALVRDRGRGLPAG